MQGSPQSTLRSIQSSRNFEMNFLVGLIVGLTVLITGGLGHDCERPCKSGDRRTCMYQFRVQEYHTVGRACFDCPSNPEDCQREECVAADGVPKPLLTVNRQLPGPAIQVCEGDRVVVDVRNGQLSDAEAIHWHGQHMRSFQYYDGVPFITQCPIHGVFRYDFRADTPGTHWWHSHIGVHRAEGVFGALVVRRAEEEKKEDDLHADGEGAAARAYYEVDSTSHVFVLHDWIHKPALDKFAGRHHSTLDDYASTILVNGKGRNSAAKIEGTAVQPTPLEVVRVTPGLRHRLRLIAASSLNCPMVVSVDRHRLTVIASDGEDIAPITADSLVMYSGERFDVILEADQPVDNYWIRVNGLIDCEQNQCVQGAVLRYDGAPEMEPTPQLVYDPNYPPGVVVNPLNSGGGVPEEMTMIDLDSLDPSVLAPQVDRQFYLAFDFKRVNNTLFYNPDLYPYNGVSKEWQINTPQLNEVSFEFPVSPPLSQPDAPQHTFCRYGEPPPCEGDFCSCTYVLEVALGETVEMVLVDEGNIGDENHPYHLHGHVFHVVAMGRLGSHTSVAEVAALDAAGVIARKLRNAVKKDTVTIPDGGYTIIRFTADNPGWWLMHCHLTFHSEIGMAAVLHVGEPEDLPPVPQGFPTCSSFIPDL